MMAIFLGLRSVKRAMEDLADNKEPSSAAAYEMEINIKGIGLAVLSYLDSPDPLYRHRVNKDQSDFERFHAKYLQLSSQAKAQELGSTIGNLFSEFLTLGKNLMDRRDRQATDLTAMTRNFERINTLIDKDLQPIVDRSAPDALAKIEAVVDMEADIAELGLWLTRYQYEPKAEYKQLLVAHDQEFRETLSRFQELNLTAAERRLGASLESLFSETHALLGKVVALEDALREGREKFIDLRSRIDIVLDDDIQVLALQELYAPRERAEEVTGRVIATLQISLLSFVLCAAGAAWLLIRSITRPVQALVDGTVAVSGGDLSYRLAPEGDDELAELGQRFNRMVGELQATTVSKQLLQESEAKLQQTVADLRREITERERAEQERARLEASLRRSEIMAVMGSLVAGVAHEVRNPLFAISSTLDAFENRFADRAMYQRYLGVLRAEVNRLTGLMRALLEYGKPTSQEFAQDSIAGVLTQAVRSYGSLAEELNVKISEPDSVNRRLVRMDRERLLQVFQNLIENAIQHSPPGGSVVLEAAEGTEEGQSWICYEIKDSGPGFAQNDLPKVFEPFFSRRRGGTGLGLSIVQRIVEEHGGQIAAGNRPEGGAVLTVRFPLVQRTVQGRGDQEVQRGTKQDLDS